MANNELFEKALDLLIEDALDKINEKENAPLSDLPDVEFSQEHETKMQQLFNSLYKKELKNKLLTYGKRAACICLVALVLTSVAVCSVDAWRANFINFFFEEDAPNSDFSFNDAGGTHYSDDNISLNYLPWGFEVKKSAVTSNGIIIYFTNDDLFISVDISKLDGYLNLDTENASIEHGTINGYDAVFMFKDDLNQIIWSDDYNYYYVCGNIPKAEIEKIARNLKKL